MWYYSLLIVIFSIVFDITVAKSFSNNIEKNDLVVTLNSPHGSRVRGIIKKSALQRDYLAFLDVPYAETTDGRNRFKEPVPKKAWQGILNATTNTKACAQPPSDEPIGNITEDCLVLSVHTPMIPINNAKKLPVLIWIHGGGFLYGQGSMYNPSIFMDEDIVVVTLNYRLGLFGFLTTEDETIQPNLGLKDQRLAIDWVQQNIEKFGGDSNNMKIAGQSAGAASVGWHTLGDRRVSFNGAILASGTALCPFALQENSKDHAFEVAKSVKSDFKATNSYDLLKLLQGASLQKLLDASDQQLLRARFLPTLEKQFSLAQTEDIDHGRITRIPTLFGFNSEEMLTMLNEDIVNMSIPNAEDLGVFLENFKLNMNESEFREAGSQLKKLYTNTTFADNRESFIRMYTDMAFMLSIGRHVESLSKYVDDTYLYQLSYRYSLAGPGAIPGMPGVGHGLDLPLLWGNPELLNDEDKIVSRKMAKIWSHFVRYGKPMVEGSKWPRSDASLTYMNIDIGTGTVNHNPRDYKRISGIMNRYIEHPITVY